MAAQNSIATAKPKGRPRGRPFPKGTTGNAGGRPRKDRALTAALEEVVDKKELGKKLWELALGGDMQALKYIYDRIEGSPTQRTEVSHDDVLEDVRRMAQERGMSDEDTEWAVKSAEEMLKQRG